MTEPSVEAAYRESGALVHTLALRALGSVEEAEDIVRRVFASAAAGGSLASRDLVHDAADRITGDLERRVRAKLAALEDPTLGVEGVTDARAVLAEADRILVRAALERLAPEAREPLERALVHGVPRYELAMCMGVPEAELEVVLRDALLSLWPGTAPGEGHADVEALASRALGIRVIDGEQSHIAGCRECRDAWRSLNDLVGSVARLPTAVPVVEPRPSLWDEVRDAVDAGPVPEADWRAEARRDAERAHRRRTVIMSAALVAASLFAGLAVVLSQLLIEPDRAAIAAATLEDPRTGGAETGGATLVAGDDGSEVLVVEGPYSEYPDAYLELWITAPGYAPVSLGQLTSSHYEVALPAGLPTAVGATVEISREPWDGDPALNGDVVARGVLA